MPDSQFLSIALCCRREPIGTPSNWSNCCRGSNPVATFTLRPSNIVPDWGRNLSCCGNFHLPSLPQHFLSASMTASVCSGKGGRNRCRFHPPRFQLTKPGPHLIRKAQFVSHSSVGPWAVKGKPVRFRCGPAAVIGDESCTMPLSVAKWMGRLSE